MFRFKALLVLLLAVAGAYANDHERAETEHIRAKRQAPYGATLRSGGFEYLLVPGDDLEEGEIYLVITNCECIDFDDDAQLQLDSGTLTIARTVDPRSFSNIETVFIDTTGSPPPSELPDPGTMDGPGTVCVTNETNFALENMRVAFFTRFSGIADFIRDTKLLPTPDPPIQFNMVVQMEGDRRLSVLQTGISTNTLMDTITITDSITRNVMSGGGVSYFGDTIFVQSPTGGVEEFSSVNELVVYNGRSPLLRFEGMSADSFSGPGTLYVNERDGVAFYTVDPFGPGDTDVVEIINEGVVENSVGTVVDGGDTFLVDSAMVTEPRVVRLNGVMSQMFPSATSIVYENDIVMILGPQNEIRNSFGGITSFTLFDNNAFMTVTGSAEPIQLSSQGGQFYYDDLGNGFFSVNPAVTSEVNSLVGDVNPTPRPLRFSLSRDSQGIVTLSENDMEIITLTGAALIDVTSDQIVDYTDDEIALFNRQGTRIATVGTGISQFTANDLPGEVTAFEGNARRSFQGPGSLYVGGSRGFYTTDSALVSQITDFLNAVPTPSVSVTSEGTLSVGGQPFVDLTEATADNVQTGSILVYNSNTTYIADAPQSIPSGTDIRVTYENSTVIVSRVQTGGSTIELKRIANVPMFTFADGLVISSFVGDAPMTSFPGGGSFFQNENTGNGFYTTSAALNDMIADEIIQNSGNVRQVINGVGELGFFDGTSYTTYSGSANMILPGARGGMYYFGGGNMFYSTDSGTNTRIINDFSRVRQVTTTRQNGFVTVNYSGESIYSFTVGSELTDTSFGPFDNFSYVNGMITGARVPGSPVAVSNLTIFNGINVQVFNSSASLEGLTGGYLVIDRMTGTAFYTTSGPARSAIQTAIQQVQEIFRRPVIDDTARGEMLIKFPTGSAPIGIEVITYEGVDVTLTCRILVANPAPTVQFKYYPMPNVSILLNATSMTPDPPTYNLLLPDVRAADNAGRYACIATNDVGQDRVEGMLTILPATTPIFEPNFFPFIPSPKQQIVFPMFEGQTSTVNVNVKNELVFPCRFRGRPNPTVRFFRGSVPINTTNSAYSVSEIRPGASVLRVDLSGMTGPIPLVCSGSTPAIPNTEFGPAVTVDLIRYDCALRLESECSATCGPGIQQGIYENCTIITNEVLPGVSIPFEDVPAGLFPPVQIVCGGGNPCPRTVFRFFVGPFEDCSRTCDGGIATRVVLCQERLQDLRDDPASMVSEIVVANVSDNMCIRDGRSVPARQRRCNTREPCPIWRAEPFGLCSCTCGGGIQFRPSVECTLPNGTVLDDSFCNANLRPASERVCNTNPCLYAWQAGNWSPCDDFFCQERNVTCNNADRHSSAFKTTVDDCFCFDAIGPRPHAARSCAENGYCTRGIWCVGEFDQCSVTCGYGQEKRDVFCIARGTDSYLTVMFEDGMSISYPNRIEDAFCDSRLKPESVRNCFRNCPGVCREQKLCKTIRNLGLCDSVLARDCCASCPNTVLTPPSPTLPPPIHPFLNVTCTSTDIDFCTLRPNTMVEFCFDLTPLIIGETAKITIVPNIAAFGADISFDPIIPGVLQRPVVINPFGLTCVTANTALTTVFSFPELFSVVASRNRICSFGDDVIPFQIIPYRP